MNLIALHVSRYVSKTIFRYTQGKNPLLVLWNELSAMAWFLESFNTFGNIHDKHDKAYSCTIYWIVLPPSCIKLNRSTWKYTVIDLYHTHVSRDASQSILLTSQAHMHLSTSIEPLDLKRAANLTLHCTTTTGNIRMNVWKLLLISTVTRLEAHEGGLTKLKSKSRKRVFEDWQRGSGPGHVMCQNLDCWTRKATLHCRCSKNTN